MSTLALSPPPAYLVTVTVGDAKGETTVITDSAGEEVFVACETDTHRILVWKKQ